MWIFFQGAKRHDDCNLQRIFFEAVMKNNLEDLQKLVSSLPPCGLMKFEIFFICFWLSIKVNFENFFFDESWIDTNYFEKTNEIDQTVFQ